MQTDKNKSRKKIASERIEKLFSLAQEVYNKNPPRSRRYIKLAREISRKLQIKIPEKHRRNFCKSCNTIFMPGVNCEIRIKKGFKIIKCKNCGKIRRIKVY